MGAIINWIILIIGCISGVIGALFRYRTLYKITGLFATRRFPPAKRHHKYAILIAARNEEKVIGKLIDSIRAQDYPAELVDVFVVADNCTDSTAEVARALGAHCYERRDPDRRTKGFALEYLVECIRKDVGIDAYEGYFVFDADNLLKKDFISRMNDSFDAGEKIITAYRNTKNFDDNWISASYGLHWLRIIRNEHRARSLFRLATRIQGTGFLFAWEVIKDGWHYTSLTEDRAFCADAVAKGYRISYNHDAEFYDEQPVTLRVAMRQRIRWAKGHLQAFVETGGTLFTHIFYTGGVANRESSSDGAKPSTLRRLINNIRLRFISFDMLTVVYPRALLQLFGRIAVFALRMLLIFNAGYGFVTLALAPGTLRRLLEWLGIELIPQSALNAALLLTALFFAYTLDSYLRCLINAVYIFIIERRRIMPIKWYKKAWFCLTFPIFDLIGKLSLVIALFMKVEWKPIPHNADLSIDELSEKHRAP